MVVAILNNIYICIYIFEKESLSHTFNDFAIEFGLIDDISILHLFFHLLNSLSNKLGHEKLSL